MTSEWKGFGTMAGTSEPDGLHLSSSGTGMLLTVVQFNALPQAGLLTTTSDEDLEVQFVWTVNAGGETSIYASPLAIARGDLVTTPIFLTDFPEWSGAVQQVGVQLAPGQSIVLNDVRFGRWNAAERVWYALRSFWTFDEYRPYSINFTWGPFLVGSAFAVDHVYTFTLPHGTSASFLAMIAVALAVAAIALYQFVAVADPHLRLQRTVSQALVVCAVAWGIFDLRMGTEFLSWVWADAREYVFASPETRTFRDRGRFYDIAERASLLVADRESYVFFAPQPWPYFGNVRYLTYPSIPSDQAVTDDTWVVYDRPDLAVDDATKQLTFNGTAVTHPGTLLLREGDSFIFRVSPQAAPPLEPLP